MASGAPHSAGSIRFAVLSGHREEVLRLISARSVDWTEVASAILRSPGLLYPILAAAPLTGNRLRNDLKNRLVERLHAVGAELLRTWLVHDTWIEMHTGSSERDAHARSLLAAECALHLALETAYAHPDEAYLGGLWHALDVLLAARESVRTGVASPPEAHANRPELRARLVSRCGVSAPLIDALAFQADALEEQLQTAHPLVRLVWAAAALASETWESRVEQLSRVTGLAATTLFSLRTDVSFIATQQSGAPRSGTRLTRAGDARPERGVAPLPSPPAIPSDVLRRAALSGCIRGAFSPMTQDAIGARFTLACRLLCQITAPMIVIADDDNRLRALPLGDDSGTYAYYAELEQRLEDDTSVVALALRTATPTSRMPDRSEPGRAVADWHVAQWLGTSGLMCLPLSIRQCRAIAVLGVERSTHPDVVVTELVADLAMEAVDAWLEIDRQDALRASLSNQIEERYREHGRRVAHEASNPLTVIKSYLAMMPEKHPETSGLGEELRILQSELDRLGILLKQVGHPPADMAEVASCSVAELLQDMHTFYGDTLFTGRGIQFELRTTPGLPPAAMPTSELKQVLLNLFRNAAEALQPGKRFSVVVPGQLIVNGTRCLEIRVIDNGPGLPSQRLAQLFTPQPSAKGGEHQGLGLSIVNEILDKWGASILCRSQPGSGTSFQLLVPVAESS